MTLSPAPSRITFPIDPHGIVYRKTAREHGITDNQLARAVDQGHLRRIWPGAFLPSSTVLEHEPLHRARTIAAMTCSTTDHVASHTSAAVLHGLSMLMPDLGRVHQRTGTATGGRVDSYRHLHSGMLDESDVVLVDGFPTTSLELTAIDLACGVGEFARALAVFDSALRLGADAEAMAESLERRRTGVGLARFALGHANGLSENPGESWGRGQMIVEHLPLPILQRVYLDERGEFVARCDYDWEGKLVGEFDGKVKYQKLLKPGEDVTAVVVREKRREDAVRRLGPMVERWVWTDLVRNVMIPRLTHNLQTVGILKK